MIDQVYDSSNSLNGPIDIGLVPCTIDHFSIDQQMRDTVNDLWFEYWLCPPLNYSVGIHGKYTSKSSSYL